MWFWFGEDIWSSLTCCFHVKVTQQFFIWPHTENKIKAQSRFRHLGTHRATAKLRFISSQFSEQLSRFSQLQRSLPRSHTAKLWIAGPLGWLPTSCKYQPVLFLLRLSCESCGIIQLMVAAEVRFTVYRWIFQAACKLHSHCKKYKLISLGNMDSQSTNSKCRNVTQLKDLLTQDVLTSGL